MAAPLNEEQLISLLQQTLTAKNVQVRNQGLFTILAALIKSNAAITANSSGDSCIEYFKSGNTYAGQVGNTRVCWVSGGIKVEEVQVSDDNWIKTFDSAN